MAYSISHHGGSDPSVELLADMVNREFNKVKGNQTKNLKRASEKSNLKLYKQGNDPDEDVDEEESALLGSYAVCITPKVS